MRKIKNIITGLLVLSMMSIVYVASAQTRVDNKNMMATVRRLETYTDRFEASLESAFDRNRVDGTELEDEIITLVKNFEIVTDMFMDRVEDNEVIPADVEALMSRALLIEKWMSRVPASKVANRDWMQIKQALNDISKTYNVAWVWTLDANPYWKRPIELEAAFDRLDTESDEFRRAFIYAMDFSKINDTEMEDKAIQLVSTFEDNMDQLEERTDLERPITAQSLETILKQALLIEAFLRTHDLSPRVRSEWRDVKATLNELAMATGVAWTWNVRPVAAPTAVK